MPRLIVDDIRSVGLVPEGDNPGSVIALFKRKFSRREREKLAGRGFALPDGSFPIATVSDLQNAVAAFGRASNKTAARAHITKRARALGRLDVLPDTWNVTKMTESPDRASNRSEPMTDIDLSGVDDEIRDEVEAQFAKDAETIARLEAELTPEPEPAPDPEVVKARDEVAAIQKRLDDVEKARAFEAALTKAAEAPILGDPETAAPHLQALAEAGEHFDWLWTKVQDVNALVNKSALFKELGVGDGGDATAQIEALAKKLQETDTGLSNEQARLLARKQRPDLKKMEREEA
jgi:hypothetical protein